MTKKVYLAGPEVFLANAHDILGRKAALAREAGFTPLSPGDLDIEPTETKKQFGLAISAVDEKMMLEADAIIANLTPFRGIAADVGTTFELGFMCALGKPVFAYTNVAAGHYERVMNYYNGLAAPTDDGHVRGPDGLSIEDFDMIDNLMLHGGVERRGGTVIVGNAPADRLYTDLDAFKRCLAAAKAALI